MKGPRVVNAASRRSVEREQHWVYGINAVRRRLEVNPASIRELRVAPAPSDKRGTAVRLAERAGIAVRTVQA
ncbi:MAG TPA: RNA methyltransferase substrate-binding domain-containing protein, partial [Candidatus Binatia bacterium]|nr:RNA methyltransferase substrate-binding domain-containing protein [Candidatus Binatia bacterium]